MARKAKNVQEEDKNPVEIPKDLTPNLPHSTTTAVLASIPAHLKDHANYKKIKKAIIQAGATKHSHGEISEWAKCFVCQRKQSDRLLMMKSLGFQSKAHYMVWERIHEQLDSLKRDRLPKYNSK